MQNAQEKLTEYFQKLMVFSENTGKTPEDSILLAGAMMAVSRVLFYDHLSEKEAGKLFDQGGIDLIELIKPTIH
jgi:hypothetical protein|tara:strand:- start:279 stop:500 length:222 start_codon:yes stop_codon:yes gene_type:complete